VHKKLLILTCIFILTPVVSQGQIKFFTRAGKVSFFSKAPIEDIRAVNNQLSCIFESESKRIVANVLIRAFEFEKALMQKHFNENYLESEKFPKATFKGRILTNEKLNFQTIWTKNLEFEGDMTIHGITRKMKGMAQCSFKDGTLMVSTDFYIHLKDYDIKIPSTLVNNIAEKIQVKVNLNMNELKN
jgi:hypothetical protein